jgi:hypothetical protein
MSNGVAGFLPLLREHKEDVKMPGAFTSFELKNKRERT